ncbi:MAG: NAD-dependent epimerase [Planctomycetota bacterium]|nr:MAG: NAD-dependent epimerase [Planctomycetota bacterium]
MKDDAMKCLVLGGCGFIGSHVVERLLRDGHDVRVFDKSNVDESNIASFRDRVSLVTGDFTNVVDVYAALEGIELVFHFVGTTVPQTSMENLAYDIETNVMASVRLLEACLKNDVRRIVFSSSGGTVYGIPQKTPITEDHPNNPICSYGVTKLAVEKYIALFNRLHGLDYRIIRYANPYGPRQRIHASQGAVAVFLGRVLEDKPVTIWGDGTVKRDYIYVQDAAEATVRLAMEEHPAGIYNVGSGRAVSLNELIETIKKVTGRKIRVDYTEARKIDVPVNVLAVGKISAALGWRPETDLESGIRRTWEWLTTGKQGQ